MINEYHIFITISYSYTYKMISETIDKKRNTIPERYDCQPQIRTQPLCFKNFYSTLSNSINQNQVERQINFSLI